MEVDTSSTFPVPTTNAPMVADPSSTPGFLPNQGAVPQQNVGGNPVFGLIVPGGPVLTDFVPMDATGTKFAMTLSSPGQLPSPLTLVNEIVCFLTNPQSLPPNHGVLLYWQLSYAQEQSGFELLGSLTPDRPSEILRTGWGEHSQFMCVGPNMAAQVTIGLSIEPMDSVRNVAMATNTRNQSKRPLVAQKIAQDLLNFMNSFDSGASGSSQMVVPKNIFERWWQRFENKSKRDPNFFMKNSDWRALGLHGQKWLDDDSWPKQQLLNPIVSPQARRTWQEAIHHDWASISLADITFAINLAKQRNHPSRLHLRHFHLPFLVYLFPLLPP